MSAVGRALAGAASLIRLDLRRDRVLLPVWVLAAGCLTTLYGSSIAALYPSAGAREALVTGIRAAPAELALLGPVFGSDVGALTAWRSGTVLLLVALASAFTVIRHSRAEEEAGRSELVGAAGVGRNAPLVAALAVATAGSVAAGALVALGLAALSLPDTGSLALGVSAALAGVLFAGVAGVAAQLAGGARTARGITGAVLALAFLLRAVGDAAGGSGGSGIGWLAFASPFGWLEHVRPFAGEHWVSLLPPAVAGALALAAGCRMAARRDLGRGLLPVRSGPAAAGRRLRTASALGWRLHRGALLGWGIGFVAIGAVVGGSVKAAVGQLATSAGVAAGLARIGGTGAPGEVYLSAVVGVLGLVAAAYAVATTVGLRAAETSGLAEPVLAAAVGRARWAGAQLGIAVLGSTALLAAGGIATGLAYGAGTHDVGRQVPRLLLAALTQLPAGWVLAGISLALFGWLPRAAVPASWGVLAVFVLLGQVGELLRLRRGVLDLSPFSHSPTLPAATVSFSTVVSLVVLVLLAGLLAGVGLAGLRRRDLS